jgi:hypothetical protein
MSLNTILATAPLTTQNFVLKANGTTIGNSLIFDNGTNVGIGTTSPADLLEVKGGNIRLSAIAGVGPQFNLYSNGQTSNHVTLAQGFALSTDNIGYLYNRANADFVFGTNNTERMRITATGIVNIGTTASTTYGTLNVIQQSVSAPSFVRGIQLVHPNGTGTTGGYIAMSMTGQKQGTIQVGDDATSGSLLLQSQGGNVLIGTTTDNGYKLNVVSGSTGEANAHLVLTKSSDFSGLHWLDATAYWIGQNSNSRQLRMYSGTNIYTGVYIAAGGSSWTGYSDERIKTDLIPIDNAINKVNQLRAVTGRYKTDDEGKSRSFLIAQDVLKVLPEAVNINNDEMKTLGVQYTDIIPLLVAAIKEQQALITSLQEQINAIVATK